VAWYFKSRAEHLTSVVESLAEDLGDRVTYLRVLREISMEGASPASRAAPATDSWSSDDFRLAVASWIEDTRNRPREGQPEHRRRRDAANSVRENGGQRIVDLARQIGPDDFARLFLAKGRALDVLTERISLKDGEPTVRYCVTLAGDTS